MFRLRSLLHVPLVIIFECLHIHLAVNGHFSISSAPTTLIKQKAVLEKSSLHQTATKSAYGPLLCITSDNKDYLHTHLGYIVWFPVT